MVYRPKRRKISMALRKRKSLRKRSGTTIARFASSRFKYRKGRKFSRMARPTTETKLMPINKQDEVSAIPIQLGAQAHYRGFVMQSVPTNWDNNLIPLGGIVTQQGSSGVNRIGNYVYFKKTHVTMEVQCEFTTAARPPVEFRVVVCKAKMSAVPAGQTDLPQSTLFLNQSGEPLGYQTPNVNGSDLMLQPLNKREWVIKSDKKFTLSHPMRTDSDGGQVGYSGYYPMKKTFVLNLGYYKKTRINSASNTPEDLDCRWLVYVFAASVGRDFPADSWEVNMRGTTSFTDS